LLVEIKAGEQLNKQTTETDIDENTNNLTNKRTEADNQRM
jgi:ABC-type metal ion transport system substrate-binding protein